MKPHGVFVGIREEEDPIDRDDEDLDEEAQGVGDTTEEGDILNEFIDRIPEKQTTGWAKKSENIA
jgi:hypothetical protein